MRYLDIMSKISIIIILLILGVGVSKLIEIDKKELAFYEYKNMKINLNQVKKIRVRVDYIITYKEDSNMDIFRKYSTSLNPKEIQNITKLLALASRSEFYNVEVESYMMFDSQKIELYHSANYLKRAENYSVNDDLLSKLSSYGLDDYQYKNLSKLKDKVYKDATTFFDDVISYAKIKRSDWTKEHIPKLGLGSNGIKFMQHLDASTLDNNLTQNEIVDITKHLEESYEAYSEIE